MESFEEVGLYPDWMFIQGLVATTKWTRKGINCSKCALARGVGSKICTSLPYLSARAISKEISSPADLGSY